MPGPVVGLFWTPEYDLRMSGQIGSKGGTATFHAADQHEFRLRFAIVQPESRVVQCER